ncbi:MAG: hypothetical protein ACPGYT_14350, partial [Nitrospirales bacterium]
MTDGSKNGDAETKRIIGKGEKGLFGFVVFAVLSLLSLSQGHAGLLYTIHDTSIPLDNRLKSIDTTTLAITDIGDVGVEVSFGGLAYDPNTDTLFMVDGRSSANLYTVNRTTGIASLTGSHGVSHLRGLAFDSTNNVLYGSRTSSGGTELYALNTGNGAATLVGDTSVSFSGLSYDSTKDDL